MGRGRGREGGKSAPQAGLSGSAVAQVLAFHKRASALLEFAREEAARAMVQASGSITVGGRVAEAVFGKVEGHHPKGHRGRGTAQQRRSWEGCGGGPRRWCVGLCRAAVVTLSQDRPPLVKDEGEERIRKDCEACLRDCVRVLVKREAEENRKVGGLPSPAPFPAERHGPLSFHVTRPHRRHASAGRRPTTRCSRTWTRW